MREHLVTRWELADQSLADRLAECQREGLPGVPREELLRYMRHAAEGIDFLNQDCRLGHRDIKPKNILLQGKEAKLGDLGLVKFFGASTGSHTGLGTVGYLPPESYDGHWNCETGDLYALAATYVKLRTGNDAYSGTVHEVIEKQKAGNPNLAGLDEGEAAAVRKALAPHPIDRPQAGAVAWVATLAGAKAPHICPFLRPIGDACERPLYHVVANAMVVLIWMGILLGATACSQLMMAIIEPDVDHRLGFAVLGLFQALIQIGAGFCLFVVGVQWQKTVRYDTSHYYDAGRRLEKQGNFDAAIMQYGLAINDPWFVEAYRALGRAYAAKGDQISAEAWLKSARMVEERIKNANCGAG